MVVLNFGNRAYAAYEIGFPRQGTWQVRFNGDWNGYSPDYDNWESRSTSADGGPKDGMRFSGRIGLGRYTAVILSQ